MPETIQIAQPQLNSSENWRSLFRSRNLVSLLSVYINHQRFPSGALVAPILMAFLQEKFQVEISQPAGKKIRQ